MQIFKAYRINATQEKGEWRKSMGFIWVIIFAILAGCTSQPLETSQAQQPSQQEQSKTYSPYHKLYIDTPEAEVWIQSRFELLIENEIEGGEMWLYTDYQGKQDQEFVMILIGDFPEAKWPPETGEKLVRTNTPIGRAYESWGPIEAQDVGIQQLGATHNFSVPPCSLARILQHKNESGPFISTIYTEGARCAVAFAPEGPINDMSQSRVRDRGRVIVKIKQR